MAAPNNILGISYFGLGAPGDGVMGATLTQFPDVEVGSPNIEGASPNETTIPTEADDAYITLNDTGTPNVFNIRLYGVTPAQMVLLAGGEVVNGFWEAPQTVPNIFLSMRLVGNEINGVKGVIEFPYAKVLGRMQGNITKNGLPAFALTITANTPTSANGDKNAPIRIGEEAA